MDVGSLIDRAEQETEQDPAWPTSRSYRSLVEEFVASRAPHTTVRWLAPGMRSYRSGPILAIESPAPDAGIEVVERNALIVFHEVLHVVHSDHADSDAFEAALAAGPEFRERLGRDVFNHLEDARIAAREHEIAPENDPYVEKLHALAVRQEEGSYRRQQGEQAWSKTPRQVFPQLRLALLERSLVGDRGSEMSPLVHQIIADCQPAIEAGTRAPATRGARAATLEILDTVFGRWDELGADLRL
jgi:hypothetical protein